MVRVKGSDYSQSSGSKIRGSDCVPLRVQSLAMKTEEQRHYRGGRLGPIPCLDGEEGSNFQLDSLGTRGHCSCGGGGGTGWWRKRRGTVPAMMGLRYL